MSFTSCVSQTGGGVKVAIHNGSRYGPLCLGQETASKKPRASTCEQWCFPVLVVATQEGSLFENAVSWALIKCTFVNMTLFNKYLLLKVQKKMKVQRY